MALTVGFARRGATAVAAFAGACAFGLAAARADVVLHEFLAPDPVEDLRLGATSSDGTMAAAIQTQGGAVASPDLDRDSDRKAGATYGGERSPPGSGRSFRVDSDTARPGAVGYDDPFTPSLAPYKREYAYDGVDEAFDLVVRDPTLVPVPTGGAPRPDDDQFFADLPVEVGDGVPVRVPGVAPGARLIALRSSPPAALQMFHDGADGWFLGSDRALRVRVVMHVAVDRAVFGSPFADVEWPRLWRSSPEVPPRVKSEGLRIARQIGVVDGTGPSEALRFLVGYFRSFAPSAEPPRAAPGAELYRELTLSRKGVCRHRAYAFTVTALALGLPTRFVHNEAHAWVEVFDSSRWHRVDLGGAADRPDSPDVARLTHVPPRDPFAWPPGAESGQAMAERTRRDAGLPRGGLLSAPTGRDPGGVAARLDEPPPPSEDPRPRSTLNVDLHGAEAKRGARIAVSGRVEGKAGACAAARVDLWLLPEGTVAAARLPLGTLVTGADGRFEGQVTVPYAVPPGDYAVHASTPGTLVCGAGESE